VHDGHPGLAVSPGELVGYVAGAIWRIVICQQNPQAGQRQPEERRDDHREVSCLIVGGQHHCQRC
jgi:hypothetical protein